MVGPAFVSSLPVSVQIRTIAAPCHLIVQKPAKARRHASFRVFTPVAKQTQGEVTSRGAKIVGGPFDGQYGPWYLKQSDVDGVNVYRVCLLISSLSAAAATTLSLTAGQTASSVTYDALALISSLAFGGALQTIHIYAKPLHNLLKILWVAGFAGAIALAASPLTNHTVTQAVLERPALLLAVGWQLVALTGLFVKEAVCFGRTEATLLIALVPALSAGHFLQIAPLALERPAAGLFAALFVFFSLRKFTQPPTDDIGDMSIFEYLKKKTGL